MRHLARDAHLQRQENRAEEEIRTRRLQRYVDDALQIGRASCRERV
jgi:hypothetical protein